MATLVKNCDSKKSFQYALDVYQWGDIDEYVVARLQTILREAASILSWSDDR